MHKVSRIYVANAGYKLAWYDGLLLQFTDVETGQPTHSVYNLVNQGGKSTFLSLVFSTFDPSKDRFLQHLSNKAQRFEHYFDEDGLPGMIVVEWQVPGDLASVTRTLVTGQIVVMKKAGDTFDPDRFFFWFHTGPDLSLESIPGPKLPGGAAQELRSREQVSVWLRSMQARHPGHFDYTTSQSEWTRALEQEGLDVEMLRNQVDFNRKEGAMDESFLDFKSEADFVRRFLALTMDSRAANDIRESVAAHCRRISRKRPLELSLMQLQRLQEVFGSFSGAAQDYQAASEALQATEGDLAVACATLDARALDRKQAAAAHLAFADSQDSAEKLQRAQKLAGLQQAEALRAEVLRRANAAAQAALDSAAQEKDVAELEIRLYRAAELLCEQEALQAEVSQLDQAIEQANAGVQPFREELGRVAAVFRQALWNAKQAKSLDAEAAKAAARSLLEQIKALEARVQALSQSKSAAERTSAALEEKLASAEEQRKTLVQAGLIGDDEMPEVARDRLVAAAAGFAEQQSQATARAGTHSAKAQQWQGKLVELTGDKARKAAEANQLDEEVLAAENQRDRLTHDRVLTRAVGAETVDPDSEVLQPALERFIQRAQDDLSVTELTLARLDESVRSIHETGLAGRDPDVARVVRKLADAGITGAMPHTRYLAEVLPDAAAARTVALSDPARFLGVAVPDASQLDTARTILTKLASVGRPVVVSVASDQEGVVEPGRIVVAPQDDSIYCKAAAQASLPYLETTHTQAGRERNEARELLRVAERVKADLQQYQAQYGDGKLAQLRQSAKAAHDLAEKLDQDIKDAHKSAADEQALAQAAQADAQRLLRLQVEREGQALKVQDYLELHAANVPGWRAQHVELRQQLDLIEHESGDLGNRKTDLETQRRTQLDTELRCAAEARHLDTEFAGVKRVDTTFDAKADLAANPRSLDLLRSEYQTALDILTTVEEERTGNLVVQRKASEKGLEAARRKYLEESKGLDTSAVRSHSNVDFASANAAATARRDSAVTAHTAAVKSQGKAEEAFSQFQRSRAYPGHSVLGVEQIPEGELAHRLEESRLQASQAEEAEAEAARRAKDARRQAREADQAVAAYDNQAQVLRSALPPDFPPRAADLSLFVDPQILGESCSRLLRARQAATDASGKAYQKANNAHERVRQLAAEEGFASVDAELAVTLKTNSLAAALVDYGRIQRAITERVAAVNSELATMDQDFERATEQLAGLVTTARDLLRHATDSMRLPDNIPIVGGRTVLKMSGHLLKMSQDDRRTALKPFMDEMAAAGNIPESGAALATAALLKIAHDRLGIQILKMVDIADEQYVPIDRLSHSGAERISMALLLYFVIAKLRYEQRAKIKSAQGGVLLLDNPFAKATARPIWQAILGLADAMGVQLILTTGIKEYETLSVFKRFLRLARTERNAATGRIHVSVADFNFRPPQAQEAA